MEEAEYLADHIAIIHRGKIIAEGTLNELISQYGKGNILHLSKCSHADVESFLQQNGFNAEKNSNGDVHVQIPYKDRILEVLSLLRREAIDYDGIDIRRPNLEEIFLHLTGSKLQEKSP
jgi:ABC-2 type transport system ATP-binding protein